MEDSINKKNIIFVFLGLIFIFLFLYKGLILSGDEYLEEYNQFTIFTEKQSQGGMKKGNLNSYNNKKDKDKENTSHNLFDKKVYDVLQNLEDLKLSLGSMEHNINKNDRLVIESLGKIMEKVNYSITKNITNNVTNNFNISQLNLSEVIEEIQDRKVNVDPLMDNLNQIIENLRSAVNDNN